jgi:hypothetical protein
MKVKTSELTGPALDWAVARCEGEAVHMVKGQLEARWTENGWKPSTDWAQGGPIIERERISLESLYGVGTGENVWLAVREEHPAVSEMLGPTPLVAAMRCYVASQIGDEVDVPEVLFSDK